MISLKNNGFLTMSRFKTLTWLTGLQGYKQIQTFLPSLSLEKTVLDKDNGSKNKEYP
ncbi:hypothetical protein SAMN02787100_3803 [Chryseobacterium sp. OV279]|nr:hypothetical protein SAMN02787100_3803 [Chryseobacterium sp. OV279]